MDTITDILTPTVSWSPVAEQILAQMSDADQALIRVAADQISRDFDPARMTLIEATREGETPFHVLPVDGRLLVFIEQRGENRIRITDVMPVRQLAAWQEKPATNQKQPDARP